MSNPSNPIYTPNTPVTDASVTGHTIQAQVELDYVRVGSEVMNNALASLGQAISITQDATTDLNALENLHNQFSVTAPSTIKFKFTDSKQTVAFTKADGIKTTITISDLQTYVSGYMLYASAYYGVPIVPKFSISMADPADPTAKRRISGVPTSDSDPVFLRYVQLLNQSKASITALIKRLSAITKPGDSSTLLAQLRTVLGNFPPSNSFADVKNWVIDNYNATTGAGVSSRGQIDQNIQNAIVAAQSSNTSQNEAVRRYMFVFEQYCQSAASILTSLQQIFDKISRGISG